MTKMYGDNPESNSWDRTAKEFRWERILDMLTSVQKEDKFSILDFGCGTGELYPYWVRKLGQDAFDFTLIDIGIDCDRL